MRQALGILRLLCGSSSWHAYHSAQARSQTRKGIQSTVGATNAKNSSKSRISKQSRTGSARRTGQHAQAPFPIEISPEFEETVLILRRGKARLFYSGSPMIYGGAVERICAPSAPSTGDPILVLDANGTSVCWGVYNRISMYCVRVLQWHNETGFNQTRNIESIINNRIQLAVDLRKALGLPSATTNVYRLINSEGDRLSGLIVDVFNGTAVVSSTAAWIEMNKGSIIKHLKASLSLKAILWRPGTSMLSLEGLHLEASLECSEVQESSPNSHQQLESVAEGGIQHYVDLRRGQKTGFYIDQRDSRAWIRSLSRGKHVLDLCCYTGGFSLAAAAGGALQVTGVDSSAAAIALAEKNAEVAKAHGAVEFVCQEVERFMSQSAEARRKWDIVILDPPKLAPNRRALQAAARKYTNLNAAAVRLLKPGGLLMTCSCSGTVAQGEGLLPLVQDAGLREGRKLTLLRSAGASADHPIDPAYPEGHYLTNLLFRVS